MMQRLVFTAIFLLTASTARADLLTAQFDGTGSGAFAGLGASSASYTETVQIAHELTGTLLDFNMTVALTGASGLSGGAIQQTNGVGLWIGNNFDAAEDIAAEETLGLVVSFAPVGGGTITSFQFNEVAHGTAALFAEATDETTGVSLTAGPSPTSLSALSGQSVTIVTQDLVGGLLVNGSVDGISSLSFDVTAAPEPSAFALCGLVSLGCVRLRRRRQGR